jgi:hypothetical protein
MLRDLRWFVLMILTCCFGFVQAQELVVPLRSNPALEPRASSPKLLGKTTANTLPFFEDFTDRGLYPNPARWVQSRQVYVNNTVAVNPIARGVATFDALGANGRPYDTVNAFAVRYADSLTSVPFDLSGSFPGDSIYLSFYYQPQGNGFSPEATDSFQLYFLTKNGAWVQQWGIPGTTLQAFKQVLIPVKDTLYLHSGFQFRFVNRASINVNDDVWNLDYIRMAAGRNSNDTANVDVAFTNEPSNYLRDYTAMPYRQYLANASGERANTLTATLRNNSGANASLNLSFLATQQGTGTVVAGNNHTESVPAYTQQSTVFSNNTGSTPAAGPRDRVVFDMKYWLEKAPPASPDANDTIVKEQVFDNYLAYDDGTAEKAYYLNLATSLPGKLAIEHHLNAPDTLRGAAILFGQQVPTSASKYFSMIVYKTIAGVNGGTTDQVYSQQDFYQPRYIDSVNGFYVYTFDNPVVLPAGTFYFGLMQPALSGSDSLYYALDVNRVGGNHLYYNVTNTWQSSTVSGALMVRPILGGKVTGSAVGELSNQGPGWGVYPNPASDRIQLQGVPDRAECRISDISGRILLQATSTDMGILVRDFPPGLYLVQWKSAGLWLAPKRWIKS